MNLEKRNRLIADHASLMEQRSGLLARANDLANGEPTPEILATLEQLVQDIRNLDSRLTALESQLADEADPAEPAETEAEPAARSIPSNILSKLRRESRRIPSGPAYIHGVKAMNASETLRSFFKAGTELESRSDLDNLARVGANPNHLATRAGLVTTATTGSYAVGQSFLPDFEKLLVDYCSYLGFSRVIKTKAGEPLRLAVDADQTGVNKNGRWIAETVADDDKAVTLDQRTFGSFTVSSNICLVSFELLEDSAIDLAKLISEALATRVGRTVAAALTSGNGTSEPQGWQTVVDSTPAGSAKIASVETVASGAVGYDDLVTLYGQMPPHAVASKSARWLMAPSTYAALLKLKDSTQRPLLQPGGEAKDGPATTLLGVPVVSCPEMQNIGTGNYPVVLGDFNQFCIRQVNDIVLQKTTERYFETRQIGYRALWRMDSRILDGGSFKALKVKA